jgi:uncharacterized phiE125 gp8 family phage protein
MSTPILITAPTAAPVTLEETKQHLRVDHSDEDALITALITAATGHLDGWRGVLRRALVTQTWRQSFPEMTNCGLRLDIAPVSSVASVTYYAPDGDTQTLAADQYQLLDDMSGGYVVPAVNAAWPATSTRADAVTVTYVAGAAVADVPPPLKVAILLLIGHWYANREAVITGTTAAAMPLAVDILTAPYRRFWI